MSSRHFRVDDEVIHRTEVVARAIHDLRSALECDPPTRQALRKELAALCAAFDKWDAALAAYDWEGEQR